MSYHPDLQLIEAYAEGSIDATHGLAVATHLEMCPRCRHKAGSSKSNKARNCSICRLVTASTTGSKC